MTCFQISSDKLLLLILKLSQINIDNIKKVMVNFFMTCYFAAYIIIWTHLESLMRGWRQVPFKPKYRGIYLARMMPSSTLPVGYIQSFVWWSIEDYLTHPLKSCHFQYRIILPNIQRKTKELFSMNSKTMN